jgi:hypothetical protein
LVKTQNLLKPESVYKIYYKPVNMFLYYSLKSFNL